MSGYLKNTLRVKQMVSNGNEGFRAKGDKLTRNLEKFLVRSGLEVTGYRTLCFRLPAPFLAMLLTAGVYDPYANVTMPWQNWMNTGFKGMAVWQTHCGTMQSTVWQL